MYPNLKKSISFITCAFLFIAFITASCSKEDPRITHYQLEGTWQLYRAYSDTTDSTYELSPDNQIIFSPKLYWHYAGGFLTDSGSYILTDAVEAKDAFTAKINYINQPGNGLYIHGDTLSLTDTAAADSVQVFIKLPAGTPAVK